MKITPRKTGIALAVILGMLVVIYLGGLLGQAFTNYQSWLELGGMTGKVQISSVDFTPGSCFTQAFTASGLKGMAVILLASGGIFAYIKLRGRFCSTDRDERNFTRSKKGTYGTSGWMNNKELKSVLELKPVKHTTGTILGQRGGSVISLPTTTQLNKHLFICGASGTMKSRAIIRNVLFQCIRRGESVVVTDPKSELFDDTANLFRRHGYEVKVFNLVDPALGDSWNCMDDLGGDTLMAQLMSHVIISNTSDDKGDRFWDSNEGNLLQALVLYVDQDSSREQHTKNLAAVYQLLTENSEKQLSAMFARLPMEHPARLPYHFFQQASEKVQSDVFLGLGIRLKVLQSEAIRKIVGRSGIDLTAPGRRKCAYFVILSDQDGALDFLSSLFFSFIFIKLVRYADATPSRRCKVPVNMVLDEFPNIGTIPDFPRRLSTIRSRDIRVCMAVQNLAQLQELYPKNQWATLLGNCDTQVMLGCTDPITAEYYSVRSGDMTVEVSSTMTTRQSLALTQFIPQYRRSDGDGKRRLLTADEVLRLPHEELLIVIRGQKLLRAGKFDFTKHPMAAEMGQLPTTGIEEAPHEPAHAAPIPVPPEPETPKPSPRKLYPSAKPPEEF